MAHSDGQYPPAITRSVVFFALISSVRNVNDGISYLNIVEGAAGELKGILLRLRELSTQSSSGTLSNTQSRTLDKEAQALVKEHNRILATTGLIALTLLHPECQAESRLRHRSKPRSSRVYWMHHGVPGGVSPAPGWLGSKIDPFFSDS